METQPMVLWILPVGFVTWSNVIRNTFLRETHLHSKTTMAIIRLITITLIPRSTPGIFYFTFRVIKIVLFSVSESGDFLFSVVKLDLSLKIYLFTRWSRNNSGVFHIKSSSFAIFQHNFDNINDDAKHDDFDGWNIWQNFGWCVSINYPL